MAGLSPLSAQGLGRLCDKTLGNDTIGVICMGLPQMASHKQRSWLTNSHLVGLYCQTVCSVAMQYVYLSSFRSHVVSGTTWAGTSS